MDQVIGDCWARTEPAPIFAAHVAPIWSLIMTRSDDPCQFVRRTEVRRTSQIKNSHGFRSEIRFPSWFCSVQAHLLCAICHQSPFIRGTVSLVRLDEAEQPHHTLYGETRLADLTPTGYRRPEETLLDGGLRNV